MVLVVAVIIVMNKEHLLNIFYAPGTVLRALSPTLRTSLEGQYYYCTIVQMGKERSAEAKQPAQAGPRSQGVSASYRCNNAANKPPKLEGLE